MALGFESFLALRYLRFHRGKTFVSAITLISILGVAVGTAALVIALAVNAGFVEDARARIHSGSAHLVVESRLSERFADAEQSMQQLADVDEVAAVAAVLRTEGMLIFEDQQSIGYADVWGIVPDEHAAVILGDPRDEALAQLETTTKSGRAPIVLGANLAAGLGAREGDLVRLLIPQLTLAVWGAQPRSVVLEVVGTYRSDHFQEDSQRAYVPLSAARQMLRAEGQSSRIEVRVQDLSQIDASRDAVKRALGDEWFVFDLMDQNREFMKALNTEKLVLSLAIGLIVIVAALNIVSMLILTVSDKTKEIGALTAIGATPGKIARIFILQGLIIGAIGTFLGLVLGAGLATIFDTYRLFPLNPDVYYLTHLPFSVHLGDLVAIGTATLLISLLATIYPARRAAALRPVEALRYE